MMMKEPILTTADLTIGYSDKKQDSVVFADIQVNLYGGELVCLLGPNGAGKSTLLRTIAGMQRPLKGGITLGRHNIQQIEPRRLARLLSVVLTERINVGLLTAYALVALGRHPYTNWSGTLTAVDEEVVRWALTAVRAQHLAQRPVNTLSDGERQKVMIARALAQEPRLMLLDEPTAYLDLPRRVEIMTILRQLAHTENRAILLSTHDLDLALRLADTIWLMPENGPMQVGTPEDLVLSGAFAAAFHDQGVMFDAVSGSFKWPHEESGQVDLVGEGLPAIWMQRALERQGFQVCKGANGSMIKIEVVNGSPGKNGNGRYHWQLTQNNETSQFDTIQALLSNLSRDQ